MIWQAPLFEAPYWASEPRKGLTAAPSVSEPETGPIKTGLLDASGAPLYRQPEPRPRIGFLK